MRAAEAAKQTTALIEEAGTRVDGGVAKNQDVLTRLEAINAQTHKVGEVVAEIAAATSQQSDGIRQVNGAVEQINTITQSVAANAEESASAAEELAGQATTMQGLVATFKLRGVKSYAAEPQARRPRATQPHERYAPRPAAPKTNGHAASSPANGKRRNAAEDLIPFDDAASLAEF